MDQQGPTAKGPRQPLCDASCSSSQREFAKQCLSRVENGSPGQQIWFGVNNPQKKSARDQYYLRSVFVWEPLRTFGASVLPYLICPNPSCKNRVGYKPTNKNTPMKVKGVLDFNNYFYLAFKRYKCDSCNNSFDNTDEQVLNCLPPSVRLSFTIHTRRYVSITEDFFQQMYRMWLTNGPSSTSKELNQMYMSNYERLLLLYLAHQQPSKGQMPQPTFGSNHTVPEMFLEQERSNEARRRNGYIGISPKQLQRLEAAEALSNIGLRNLKSWDTKKLWGPDNETEIKTLFSLVETVMPYAMDSHPVFSDEWMNAVFEKRSDPTRPGKKIEPDFSWVNFVKGKPSKTSSKVVKSRAKAKLRNMLEQARSILEPRMKALNFSSFEDVLGVLNEEKERKAWNDRLPPLPHETSGGDADATTSMNANEEVQLLNPPEDFEPYGSSTGYNGYVFNKNIVNDLAMYVFKKRRPWLVQSLSSNYVDFLSIDTCWKPQKWFRIKLAGTNTYVPVYRSLVVGLTGADLPAFMCFQHYFERHVELKPKLIQVRDHMQRNYPGWSLPAAWTDKCCDNRKLLQDVFGESCLSLLDSFHWFQRFDDFINKDCPAYYKTQFVQALEKSLYLFGEDALKYMISKNATGKEKRILQEIQNLGEKVIKQVKVIPGAEINHGKIQHEIDSFMAQDDENVQLNEERQREYELQVSREIHQRTMRLGRELRPREVQEARYSIRSPSLLPVLFSREAPAKLSAFIFNQLNHIQLGCLADPVGCGKPLFFITPDGAVKQARGTSKVENFFSVIGEKFKTNSKARCGPARADAILLETAEEFSRRKMGVLKGDPLFQFHSMEFRFQANSLYSPFGKVLYPEAVAKRTNPNVIQLGAHFLPVDTDASTRSAQTEVSAEIFLHLYDEQLQQIKNAEEQIDCLLPSTFHLYVPPTANKIKGKKRYFEQPPLAKDGRDIGRSFFPSLVKVLGRNRLLESNILTFFGEKLASLDFLQEERVDDQAKQLVTRIRETLERSTTKQTREFFWNARRKACVVFEEQLLNDKEWVQFARSFGSRLVPAVRQAQRPSLPEEEENSSDTSGETLREWFISSWRDKVLGHGVSDGQPQIERPAISDDEHGGLLFLCLLARIVQMELKTQVLLFITFDQKDLEEFEFPTAHVDSVEPKAKPIKLYFSCVDGCIRPLYLAPHLEPSKSKSRITAEEFAPVATQVAPFTLCPSGKLERTIFFMMLKSQNVDTSTEEKITAVFNAIIHKKLAEDRMFILGGVRQWLRYKTELHVRDFLVESRKFLSSARDEAITLLEKKRKEMQPPPEILLMGGDSNDDQEEPGDDEDDDEEIVFSPLMFATFDDVIETTKGVIKIEEWNEFESGQETGYRFLGEPLTVLKSPTDPTAIHAPFQLNSHQRSIVEETEGPGITASDLNFRSVCKSCLQPRANHLGGFGKYCTLKLGEEKFKEKLDNLKLGDFGDNPKAFSKDCRLRLLVECKSPQRVQRPSKKQRVLDDASPMHAGSEQSPYSQFLQFLSDASTLPIANLSLYGKVKSKNEVLERSHAIATMQTDASFSREHVQLLLAIGRLLCKNRDEDKGYLNDYVINLAFEAWLSREIGERSWGYIPSNWTLFPHEPKVYVWHSSNKDSPDEMPPLDMIFIPYCTKYHGVKHWILFVALPKEGKLELFDSLPSGQYVGDASGHVLRMIQLELEISSVTKWTLEVRTSPQQSNCHDCGVFTLANALALLLGISLTKEFVPWNFREHLLLELLRHVSSGQSRMIEHGKMRKYRGRHKRIEMKAARCPPGDNDSVQEINLDDGED